MLRGGNRGGGPGAACDGQALARSSADVLLERLPVAGEGLPSAARTVWPGPGLSTVSGELSAGHADPCFNLLHSLQIQDSP